MPRLKAHFLVASPRLPDSNFFRSVVLIAEHSAEGAFGLVINRPSNNTILEVGEWIEEDLPERHDRIYVGGPVPGPLLVLHTEEDWGDSQVLSGLFMTTERARVLEVLRHSQRPIRVFSGYSGWGPDQLDQELKQGGWLTTPATIEDLYSDHETVWDRMAKRIHLDILSPLVGPGTAPGDAGLN